MQAQKHMENAVLVHLQFYCRAGCTFRLSLSASTSSLRSQHWDSTPSFSYLFIYFKCALWLSNRTLTTVNIMVTRRLLRPSTETVLKSSKASFPVVHCLLILSVLLGFCVLVCLHTCLCAANELAVESNCFSCSSFSRGAYGPLQP